MGILHVATQLRRLQHALIAHLAARVEPGVQRHDVGVFVVLEVWQRFRHPAAAGIAAAAAATVRSRRHCSRRWIAVGVLVCRGLVPEVDTTTERGKECILVTFCDHAFVDGTCAFAHRSGIFAACTLRRQGRVGRVEDKSGALWWFAPGMQGAEAEPFARRAAPKAAAMPDLPTCKRRDKCHITKTTQAGVRAGVRAGGQVGVWQAWGRRAYLLDTRQTRPLAEESAICRLPMARQNGPGVDRQVSEESCLFRRQQPVLMQLARRVYRRVCDNNRIHAMKPKSLPSTEGSTEESTEKGFANNS